MNHNKEEWCNQGPSYKNTQQLILIEIALNVGLITVYYHHPALSVFFVSFLSGSLLSLSFLFSLLLLCNQPVCLHVSSPFFLPVYLIGGAKRRGLLTARMTLAKVWWFEASSNINNNGEINKLVHWPEGLTTEGGVGGGTLVGCNRQFGAPLQRWRVAARREGRKGWGGLGWCGRGGVVSARFP